MAVFIGTLHVKEPQIGACIEAVGNQKGVKTFHSIISGKKELDAHNTLWDQWNVAREKYEMFVKVDADTVLIDDHIISKILQIMKEPRVTGIQIPIYDYFTDRNIAGLNCFSSDVYFQHSSDALFCDRGAERGHGVVIKNDKRLDGVTPAANHCPDPDILQSFHYGLHRAAKGQKNVIARIQSAYERNKDKYRKWALIGAEYANSIPRDKMNYSDTEFMDIFEKAKRENINFL